MLSLHLCMHGQTKANDNQKKREKSELTWTKSRTCFERGSYACMVTQYSNKMECSTPSQSVGTTIIPLAFIGSSEWERINKCVLQRFTNSEKSISALMFDRRSKCIIAFVCLTCSLQPHTPFSVDYKSISFPPAHRLDLSPLLVQFSAFLLRARSLSHTIRSLNPMLIVCAGKIECKIGRSSQDEQHRCLRWERRHAVSLIFPLVSSIRVCLTNCLSPAPPSL